MGSDMQHQDQDCTSEMKNKEILMQAGRQVGEGEFYKKARGSHCSTRYWSANTLRHHVMPPPLSQVPGPFSICTEQPPPPAAGGRRTTVSLHSLADAALAGASRRPQLARSPSSIALPPISTLLPAASAPAPANKTSAQKLPPRSQAASSQPFQRLGSCYFLAQAYQCASHAAADPCSAPPGQSKYYAGLIGLHGMTN